MNVALFSQEDIEKFKAEMMQKQKLQDAPAIEAGSGEGTEAATGTTETQMPPEPEMD